MTNLCIQNLDEINFFKPKEKKPIMLENLEIFSIEWNYLLKKPVY